MKKVYDISFKAGFGLTIFFFVAMNFVSYQSARLPEKKVGEIWFVADHYFQGVNWGFPFYWWGYSDWMFEDGIVGLILNFSAIVGTAFIVGFFLKFLTAKMK